MEGTRITELRTAAASAVAADALTPPGPKIVAMLGSGAASAAMRSPARDPAGERAAHLELRPGERCALREGHRRYAPRRQAAVRGADIVCTVTSAMEPVLERRVAQARRVRRRGRRARHGASSTTRRCAT